MKHFSKLVLFVLFGMMAMFSGCSCEGAKAEVEDVADTMTGAKTIRHGEMMKDQLKDLNKKREADLEKLNQ